MTSLAELEGLLHRSTATRPHGHTRRPGRRAVLAVVGRAVLAAVGPAAYGSRRPSALSYGAERGPPWSLPHRGAARPEDSLRLTMQAQGQPVPHDGRDQLQRGKLALARRATATNPNPIPNPNLTR